MESSGAIGSVFCLSAIVELIGRRLSNRKSMSTSAAAKMVLFRLVLKLFITLFRVVIASSTLILVKWSGN